MFRALRSGFLALCVVAVLVVAGQGDFRPSAVERAIFPYEYNLVGWEFSHFPDKWMRQASFLLPWRSKPDRAQRIASAKEYFDLYQEQSLLERLPAFHDDDAEELTSEKERTFTATLKEVKGRRQALRPGVEEIIESEISAVLAEHGFESRIGLIFPPVDMVLSSPPSVLVLSARDHIHLEQTVLLLPGISHDERNRIEELVFQREDLSALVENTGGVATYPSVVYDSASLHRAPRRRRSRVAAPLVLLPSPRAALLGQPRNDHLERVCRDLGGRGNRGLGLAGNDRPAGGPPTPTARNARPRGLRLQAGNAGDPAADRGVAGRRESGRSGGVHGGTPPADGGQRVLHPQDQPSLLRLPRLLRRQPRLHQPRSDATGGVALPQRFIGSLSEAGCHFQPAGRPAGEFGQSAHVPRCSSREAKGWRAVIRH